ncbi:MAG: hypothetical protein WA584_19955 [Pyrinomonadaceae bacterium]
MSLTSFISQPSISKTFRDFVVKPEFVSNKPILATPLTNNYRIIGTAFDYLLRFYIEHNNPDVQSKHWISENSVRILESKGSDLSKIAKERFDEAKSNYQLYIKNGVLTEDLIAGTIYLAYLDVVFRAGVNKLLLENLKEVDKKDVEDLKNLISIVPEKNFKSKKACYLNPTFGRASMLVGGADADLIIDERIIDIKTTKDFRLKSESLYQLLGYYILLSLGGVNKENVDYLNEVCQINSLGIYYSRHGFLYEISLTDLISEENLISLTKWFIESARPNPSSRLYICSNYFGQAAKQIVDELGSKNKN